MSSTHVFTVKDVCARLRVNVAGGALELDATPPVAVAVTPGSSSNKESGSIKSGSGVPLPLASSISPTGSDSTLVDPPPRLPAPFEFAEACNNQQKAVTQSNCNCNCNWQSRPGSPTTNPPPFPLDLVYGLWHTYVAADEEDSGIVLSLESSIDGDIFGVGKRPVQREIEKDGCIQLVFVKE